MVLRPLFAEVRVGDAAGVAELRNRGAKAPQDGSADFRWSSKWWPGTIPLVVFWAMAAWTTTVPLEADLAARSTAALKNTMLDKGRIAVAGRDVTFAADAFSEDGRRGAVAAVEAVPGVRLVNDETRLIPKPSPSFGRPSATSSGLPCRAVRRCRRARPDCWRPLTRRSAAWRWSIRPICREARRRFSTTRRCCCLIRSAN